MSAIHQLRRPAQAGRIVTAMVAGSRTADTEPSETDTHPGSGVRINWLGITGPAEWKPSRPASPPADGQAAAASVTRPLQQAAAEAVS